MGEKLVEAVAGAVPLMKQIGIGCARMEKLDLRVIMVGGCNGAEDEQCGVAAVG